MSRTIDTTIHDYRQQQAERERQQRLQRARQKRAMGSPPNGEHGASGYGNYGCRCDTCRTEWRKEIRKYRDHKPSRLAQEVDRLKEENARLNEENAMLWCRLQELDR